MKLHNEKFGTLSLLIASLFISCLLTLSDSPVAYGDEVAPDGSGLGKINIRLTGNIVALSCEVDPADVNRTINLGDWATRQLAYPDGHSEAVDFAIKLTGCAASGVKLTFTGDADSSNSSLLALNDQSSATGVAVEIMDASHKRLPLNEEAERVAVDNNGNVSLNFAARYLSTDSKVTAGSANADSVFTLIYD